MQNKVGVVGLGIMGGALARNLVAAGWQVLGHDIDAKRCAELQAAGIAIRPDAAALAREAPVLLLSLPSPAAALATARTIAASGAERRIVIEASTLALKDKLAIESELRAAGHVALDCPISGTGAQAVTKDLVIYASGDSQSIEALRPLFAGFSRAVHDVGPFGNGSRMKFVANLLVAIHNVASAEAMVLGVKSGLDPRQVVDLVTSGAGTSRVFELRAPMMAARHYQPASMRMEIWQKDMAVISQFAAELGCPTPLLSATMPIYASAMATGHAADDTAAVCAVLEAMAGMS
ncbi:MAG TPA: NAD(P)-dependent oxidoreductase [Acetobacteraceae bacterium]|nr:NAD(P)-dependent oxidoreductase [Acetobacteraceae bacterium]